MDGIPEPYGKVMTGTGYDIHRVNNPTCYDHKSSVSNEALSNVAILISRIGVKLALTAIFSMMS